MTANCMKEMAHNLTWQNTKMGNLHSSQQVVTLVYLNYFICLCVQKVA